ncbi:ABC transporter substrate-binding protein [Candidatus Babeliales bacterium]|nr:ABC transporter substrate-binding protein [Candidatus Babeliales bacterium]
MKKILYLAIFGLHACLTGYLAYLLYAPESKVVHATATRTHRVAILTPVTHPSLEQIEQGFRKTLQQDTTANYECTTYNANGNRSLMRSQVEEILAGNYDLAFAIARQPAQMLKEISIKKQQLVPIVFGAVSDPVGSGIIDAEQASNNNVTGVIEVTNYELQLALLHALKPSTKRMLLVYDPNSGFGKDKEEIVRLAGVHGIEVMGMEVYAASEIYGKVSSAMSTVDAVMVLKDNTVVSGLEGLIKLCNQHGVTLYTTDLDSPAKGAALGFGVEEYDFGVEGAKKALLILNEGKNPTNIPSTPLANNKIKLNTQAAAAQGLPLSRETVFLMNSGVVI